MTSSHALRPTRRDMLKAGIGAGAALAGWRQTQQLLDALAACPGGQLSDVEHIVIFIQGKG